MEELEQSGGVGSVDIDQILTELNTETPAQPETKETAAVSEKPIEEQTPAEQAKTYELIRKGTKRTFTAEEMIPFAQKGWDYEEKMREFNVNRMQTIAQEKAKWEAEFNPKFKDLETKLSRYSDVDKYIQRDPQWWEFVQGEYQKRLTEQGGNAHNSGHNPVIESLKSELNQVKEYVTSKQEQERIQAEAEKDTKLDTSVADYKGQNSHFDWSTTDNNGLDLEKRILKHAIDNNIGSFKAAANDYLFDEHMKRSQIKAKEETGKEIKKQTKLGLGPVTDKPVTKTVERTKNVRSKSYSDLVDEALSELSA
jgi:hypothetical protein